MDIILDVVRVLHRIIIEFIIFVLAFGLLDVLKDIAKGFLMFAQSYSHKKDINNLIVDSQDLEHTQ